MTGIQHGTENRLRETATDQLLELGVAVLINGCAYCVDMPRKWPGHLARRSSGCPKWSLA